MAYTPSLNLTFFRHQSQIILCHLQLCLSSAFILHYLKIVFFSDQPFPASCVLFWQLLYNFIVTPALAWATKECKFPSVRPCTYSPWIKSTNCKPLQLISLRWLFYLTEIIKKEAGLGGSAGCASGLRVRSPLGWQHFFVEIDHKYFLRTRAVVSFWRKNEHLYCLNA